MAISKAQLKAADIRMAAEIARGPVAHAARYDSRRGLVVITLDRGCEFSFPVALAEGLKGASRAGLSQIEISPTGLGLHWPLLDADLYVPALIEGVFGSRRWMRQIGRLGGSSRSSAKVQAARENGRRGGRPRKTRPAP